MAGYSGTPLVRKLGIKSDFVLSVINPPDDYSQLVSPLPDGVTIQSIATGELDLAHIFTTSRSELYGEVRRMRDLIKQDGMIWVSWPKKASKVTTDVTEDVVREIALPLGLVDVKVCAVDEIWSGLKLVIRKELRTA